MSLCYSLSTLLTLLLSHSPPTTLLYCWSLSTLLSFHSHFSSLQFSLLSRDLPCDAIFSFLRLSAPLYFPLLPRIQFHNRRPVVSSLLLMAETLQSLFDPPSLDLSTFSSAHVTFRYGQDEGECGSAAHVRRAHRHGRCADEIPIIASTLGERSLHRHSAVSTSSIRCFIRRS